MKKIEGKKKQSNWAHKHSRTHVRACSHRNVQSHQHSSLRVPAASRVPTCNELTYFTHTVISTSSTLHHTRTRHQHQSGCAASKQARLKWEGAVLLLFFCCRAPAHARTHHQSVLYCTVSCLSQHFYHCFNDAFARSVPLLFCKHWTLPHISLLKCV